MVEEFFELFKTAWEVYRPGWAYDVVIATDDRIPEPQPKLLLVFGSETRPVDVRIGVVAGKKLHSTAVTFRESALPVSGDLLTFASASAGSVGSCLSAGAATAGVRVGRTGSTVLRLGYDLFDEVERLLSSGQPVTHAEFPTLDLHISVVRECILDAGLSLLEFVPAPAGYSYSVCLTHDIDFIGIRRHFFDHTMFGFLYRATVGSLREWLARRLSTARLVRNWFAAACLPLVYLGWARDFWEPFEWYLRVEKGLPATYFLIPFKRRAGDKVSASHASRRASSYDINDVKTTAAKLMENDCEIGVHGLDAWHDVNKGREELERVATVSGATQTGIRIHWLLQDANTRRVLEQSGFDYDSTVGYNDNVGFRSGTTQPYRPLDCRSLMELPLHIQDGALFYSQKLHLSEAQAWGRCERLMDHARKAGGVLTILWHDRSHAPERFWGDFYVKLVDVLKSSPVWFTTGGRLVSWFRKRREVRFERVAVHGGTRTRICYEGGLVQPPFTVRVHGPAAQREKESTGAGSGKFVEISWDGSSVEELEAKIPFQFSTDVPDIAQAFQS